MLNGLNTILSSTFHDVFYFLKYNIELLLKSVKILLIFLIHYNSFSIIMFLLLKFSIGCRLLATLLPCYTDYGCYYIVFYLLSEGDIIHEYFNSRLQRPGSP